jgi:hypothetical protein
MPYGLQGGTVVTIRLTLLFILLIAPFTPSFSESAWVLYFEAKSYWDPALNAMVPSRHKPYKKFYYDRQSINEVEPNIYEVYHKKTSDDTDGLYTISQYWFDCGKMMMATGTYKTYVLGKEYVSGNLFKRGWYKLREPYKNIIMDPELILMPIICNR